MNLRCRCLLASSVGNLNTLPRYLKVCMKRIEKARAPSSFLALHHDVEDYPVLDRYPPLIMQQTGGEKKGCLGIFQFPPPLSSFPNAYWPRLSYVLLGTSPLGRLFLALTYSLAHSLACPCNAKSINPAFISGSLLPSPYANVEAWATRRKRPAGDRFRRRVNPRDASFVCGAVAFGEDHSSAGCEGRCEHPMDQCSGLSVWLGWL